MILFFIVVIQSLIQAAGDLMSIPPSYHQSASLSEVEDSLDLDCATESSYCILEDDSKDQSSKEAAALRKQVQALEHQVKSLKEALVCERLQLEQTEQMLLQDNKRLAMLLARRRFHFLLKIFGFCQKRANRFHRYSPSVQV